MPVHTHTHIGQKRGGGERQHALLEITSSSSVDLATPYPRLHQDVAMITAGHFILTNSLIRSDPQISAALSFYPGEKSAASSAVWPTLCLSVRVAVRTSADMNNRVSAFSRHQVYIISCRRAIKSSSFRLNAQLTPSSCSGLDMWVIEQTASESIKVGSHSTVGEIKKNHTGRAVWTVKLQDSTPVSELFPVFTPFWIEAVSVVLIWQIRSHYNCLFSQQHHLLWQWGLPGLSTAVNSHYGVQ